MTVYDRWHRSHPPADAAPCKCGRGKNRLYPSSEHGVGRRWQVRWYDDTGKQCKRNFDLKGGGRDETDPDTYAEAYDAKVTSELNTDTYIDPEAGKVTLQEFAKQWQAGLTVDPYTRYAIDGRLAHIYDVEAGPRSRRAEGTSIIGPVAMAQLARRPSLVKQWINSLERKGLSRTYIRDIVRTLSAIFAAAIDDGIVNRNPTKAKSVTIPTADKKVIRAWTPAMAAAARGFLEHDKRAGAMVDLGTGAGLRQGEIFAFAEEDIEFLGARRRIWVRRQVKLIDGQLVFAPPKGGKEREVPLSDSLGRRLAAHLKEHPPVAVTLPWRTPDSRKQVTARLLFVRPDGRPWHRKNFVYTWHRVRRAVGAEETPENGMHALRHTFASVVLANGVDILKLAAWLGHEDPGFTLRTYTHFMPDLADKGRAAVDAFIEPPDDGPDALDMPSEGSE